MKTPDEIKTGLEYAKTNCLYVECCEDICPYNKYCDSSDPDMMTEIPREIVADGLAYIQQLEEDNAKQHEKIMQLYIALEDMQSIVQSITKDSKTTFQQLITERDEAYEAICAHCMDIPCQENECYWYRKMNQTEETKT